MHPSLYSEEKLSSMYFWYQQDLNKTKWWVWSLKKFFFNAVTVAVFDNS